jgi:hypothetical protein
VPGLGEVEPSASPELPGVGLADPERLRDVPERVVERFPEHEDGAFDRRQPLQQELDGVLEVRRPLGGHRRVLRGANQRREPAVDGDLAARARGDGDVEREPRRDLHEERDAVAHLCAVRPLPADPDVLNDVLGVGHPAQQPVRDPEQAWPDALEICSFLGRRGGDVD